MTAKSSGSSSVLADAGGVIRDFSLLNALFIGDGNIFLDGVEEPEVTRSTPSSSSV